MFTAKYNSIRLQSAGLCRPKSGGILNTNLSTVLGQLFGRVQTGKFLDSLNGMD